MPIEFIIPLKPCVKKNSQQIVFIPSKYSSVMSIKTKKPVSPRIIQNERYRSYEKACKDYIPDSNIDYPVNVKTVFYMPTRRRVDLSNLLEAIHDIMTKYNCISDDNCNIIYSTDGSCVKYDKENPRTEVEITKLEGVVTIKDM